jgi:hypothetical protein
MDDITALRQWHQASAVMLFKPQTATRVRYSMYTDTPVPPDEPSAENPPDGAIVDYFLPSDAKNVTMEIVDGAGRVVRRYSSDDKFPAPADVGNWPWYWFRPLSAISTKAGMQRYVWDLHLAPPPVADFSLPISATPRNTLRDPQGPFANPGLYSVRLTVDGVKQSQFFNLRMDPRVKTAGAALKQQYALSVAMYDSIAAGAEAMAEIKDLRAQLADRRGKVSGSAQAAVDSMDKKLGALAGSPDGFAGVQSQMLAVMGTLQGADIVPTTQAVAAAGERAKMFAGVAAKWVAVQKTDVPAVNSALKGAGAEAVVVRKIKVENVERQPEGGDADDP